MSARGLFFIFSLFMLCYTVANMSRTTIKSAFIAIIALGLPIAALAQFKGPTQTPTGGNVPGVIWNASGSSVTQPNAQVDFTGTNWITNPTVKSDFGLTNGRSFRVDLNGLSTYNIQNLNNGLGNKPFQFTDYGDLFTPGVTPYVGAGYEGRMQARKFCFYPGTNPGDCITAWPSAGAGQYVLKTGDAMSGQLTVTRNLSGAIGTPTSTVKLNLSSSGMTSGNASALDINLWHAGGSTPGTLSGVNVYAQSNGGTGGTSVLGGTFLVTPDVGANLYSGAGIQGWYAPTTDFTNVQFGYGVQGYAVNQAPTKWMPQMNGVFGDAEGKGNLLIGVRGDATSLVNVAGVNQITGVHGNAYLHSVFQTPLAVGVYGQVYGDRSASEAYGMFGEIKNVNDVITRAAAVKANVNTPAAYAWGDVMGVDSTVTSTGAVGNMYGVKTVLTKTAGGSVSGVAYGVYSDTSAVPGSWASANVGDTIGVYGTDSASGQGVLGFGPHGVVGVGGPGGDGVYAIDGGDNTYGIEGFANGANSVAIHATAEAAGGIGIIATGTVTGVEGHSELPGGYGAKFTGEYIGVNGIGTYGVRGITTKDDSIGVYGYGTGGTGVGGYSLNGTGGSFTGAVEGLEAATRLNGTGIALRAHTNDGSAIVDLGSSNGVAITATGSAYGLYSAGTVMVSNAPQWSSWNLGPDFIVGGWRNPAIAFLSNTGTNPWAEFNTGGGLAFAWMPPLGNIATPPAIRFSIDSSGNLSAPNNTLDSCAWTAFIADGTAISCPAATPIMTGIQRSGTTMRANCCAL